MRIVDLIQQKRRGTPLSTEQINWLVQGALTREIADYQLAALLMVICYEGLQFDETLALTSAFVDSGSQLDWPGLKGPVVDKHSTGGVGDKVSLLLVPWLAAAGCQVPKMSGRGLGHTGGTIDKLESIPGFTTALDATELLEQLRYCGCAIVAQSRELVPADGLFYALRDATGTVNEPGLIAASILSKKIAGGAEHIVLDIKFGSGAFFANHDLARQFGALAMHIGDQFQRRIGFVVSTMEEPLGHSVGNALEVEEALAVARARQAGSRLVDVCLELGSLLLTSSGITADQTAACDLMIELLASGALAERQQQWIAAQGGRLGDFAVLLEREKQARRVEVSSAYGGQVLSINALAIGRLANRLGAGRSRKEDAVDPFAGVELCCEAGSPIEPGEALATLYPGPSCKLSEDEMSEALRAAIFLRAQ